MDLTNHPIILNSFDSETRNSVFTLDSRDPIILNIPASCESSTEAIVYIKQYCSDLLDTEAAQAAAQAAIDELNNSIGEAI